MREPNSANLPTTPRRFLHLRSYLNRTHPSIPNRCLPTPLYLRNIELNLQERKINHCFSDCLQMRKYIIHIKMKYIYYSIFPEELLHKMNAWKRPWLLKACLYMCISERERLGGSVNLLNKMLAIPFHLMWQHSNGNSHASFSKTSWIEFTTMKM